MLTKRFTYLLGIFAVLGILAFGTAAFAYGHGQGCGGNTAHGYGHKGNCVMDNVQLTEEQQKKFDAIMDEFSARTLPLHEDLRAKHMELNALAGNDNVKPEKITQLVNGIKELRSKLFAERDAFAEKVKKEIGIELPAHSGMRGGFHGKHGYHRGSCPYSS